MKSVLSLCIFLTMIACMGITVDGEAKSSRPNIKSFIYQLQKVNIEQLFATEFDLAIIDWEFCDCTLEDIRKLQEQGKLVVSYLSIGEAESYRDYWKDWGDKLPGFVEKQNPDWEANYKVKFWDLEWQNIVFNKLDKVVEAGYDGIYLDIIDAYYYFERKGRKSARREMQDFVIAISKRAKAKNPAFLVIPQNSPELATSSRYMAAIDGLGKEDTWSNGDEEKKLEDREWELKHLDMIRATGRFILATDYPTEHKKKCNFIKKAKSRKFIPFIGTRALDSINAMPKSCP